MDAAQEQMEGYEVSSMVVISQDAVQINGIEEITTDNLVFSASQWFPLLVTRSRFMAKNGSPLALLFSKTLLTPIFGKLGKTTLVCALGHTCSGWVKI